MTEDSYIEVEGDQNIVVGPGGQAAVQIIYKTSPLPKTDPARLEQANQHFSSMPTDEVPAVCDLPDTSHMPWPAHGDFVGREADLKRLASILKAKKTAAIGQIAAATGMGGIGKTQLASAFAHRYGQFFNGGVHWISLADPKTVPAEIISAGLKMFPDGGFSDKPQEEQLALVLGAWMSPVPRLLVFDNCEDEMLLKAWRPPSGGARIVITSRKQQWSRALGVAHHALGLFSRRESIELLLKHRVDLEPDDCDLDQIADRLGDLPLALHLAGSYLERYRFDSFGQPSAYLNELKKPYFLEHASLIEGEASPTDHEQHVGQTFELSYARLDPEVYLDRLALELLSRSSCFAPGQPIPRDLLFGKFEDDEECSAKVYSDAVGRLLSLGLLKQEEDGRLILHRLLVLFVKHRAKDIANSQFTVEKIVQTEANIINQSGLPAPLLLWQGHLRVVAEEAEKRKSKAVGELFNSLGWHLHVLGDYAGAENYYKRALAFYEKTRGREHPIAGPIFNNLGHALHYKGDLESATINLRRGLNINEKFLKPDHPEVVRNLNNLGIVLRDVGDLTGAMKVFERVLAIHKGALSHNHPNLALGLNNLGMVLQAQGHLDSAVDNFRHALRIYEKTIGSSHPLIAICLNNIGGVLKKKGDVKGAKANFERALGVLEDVFGPEHPNSQTVRANLEQVLLPSHPRHLS